MNSKAGVHRRRAVTQVVPACIAKLFKFSCFGARQSCHKLRAPPLHKSTFEFICVYQTICGKEVTARYRSGESPPFTEEFFKSFFSEFL